jgi:DinB family
MHISTKFAGRLLICCVMAAAPMLAFAQAAAPEKPAVGTKQEPKQVYGKLLSLMEQEFVSAAEAMPEDKYDFSPTQGEFKGVRSFGEQVKHVAEANGYFFHDPTKPMVDNRADIAKLKTKAEIVKALKDSFVEAHAYVVSITTENAFVATANGTHAGMASFGLAHMMDHYGQLVVYLRMNGIVPPASRGGNM